MGLIEDAEELCSLRVLCDELFEENTQLREQLVRHETAMHERIAYDVSPDKLLNLLRFKSGVI